MGSCITSPIAEDSIPSDIFMYPPLEWVHPTDGDVIEWTAMMEDRVSAEGKKAIAEMKPPEGRNYPKGYFDTVRGVVARDKYTRIFADMRRAQNDYAAMVVLEEGMPTKMVPLQLVAYAKGEACVQGRTRLMELLSEVDTTGDSTLSQRNMLFWAFFMALEAGHVNTAERFLELEPNIIVYSLRYKYDEYAPSGYLHPPEHAGGRIFERVAASGSQKLWGAVFKWWFLNINKNRAVYLAPAMPVALKVCNTHALHSIVLLTHNEQSVAYQHKKLHAEAFACKEDSMEYKCMLTVFRIILADQEKVKEAPLCATSGEKYVFDALYYLNNARVTAATLEGFPRCAEKYLARVNCGNTSG